MKKVVISLIAMILCIPVLVSAETGYTVDSSKVKVEVGKTVIINVIPDGVTGKIEISSKDTSIATTQSTTGDSIVWIEKGLDVYEINKIVYEANKIEVKGVKEGTTKIVVKSMDLAYNSDAKKYTQADLEIEVEVVKAGSTPSNTNTNQSGKEDNPKTGIVTVSLSVIIALVVTLILIYKQSKKKYFV